MKQLLIFRHAKSSWKDLDLVDYNRPLNKRGKYDAPRMGEFARSKGLLPDLILSSPAIRAKQTVELFTNGCGYGGEIRYLERLYQGDPEDYIDALKEIPEPYNRVMVVGHNPGLEELLWQFADKNERLSTASLALINLPIKMWKDLDIKPEGELVHIWRPKEI
jgi:phosphohistidine phosphatase